jgi:hypothetical protein
MKKDLFLFLSLILGFMVASCQSDMEEVMNFSDEFAVTRTEVVDPEENEIIDESVMSTGITDITGYRIIVGSNSVTYTAVTEGINLAAYNWAWEYNTSILTCTGGGDGYNYITLTLSSSNTTSDTYLKAKLINRTTGQADYIYPITIGCNGPIAGTSSLRVVRASDGVEVYPSYIGLSPNTWYYAYFSNSMAQNMTLSWTITNTTSVTTYGYNAYFQTNGSGYCFVTVKGQMPGASVSKNMLSLTLYGGAGLNASGEDTEEKQGSGDSEETI